MAMSEHRDGGGYDVEGGTEEEVQGKRGVWGRGTFRSDELMLLGLLFDIANLGGQLLQCVLVVAVSRLQLFSRHAAMGC